MTDQELRALVRDAVARHMGSRVSSPDAASAASPPSFSRAAHPSHAVYITLVNADDACVIEPSVPCNHCNYCKSHGH